MRKEESQNFLLEPLLALTGSLTLKQTDTVSNLHKCDIASQLFLSGKLSIPEAILWLDRPNNHEFDDDTHPREGQKVFLDSNSDWTCKAICEKGATRRDDGYGRTNFYTMAVSSEQHYCWNMWMNGIDLF